MGKILRGTVSHIWKQYIILRCKSADLNRLQKLTSKLDLDLLLQKQTSCQILPKKKKNVKRQGVGCVTR